MGLEVLKFVRIVCDVCRFEENLSIPENTQFPKDWEHHECQFYESCKRGCCIKAEYSKLLCKKMLEATYVFKRTLYKNCALVKLNEY